MSDLFDRPHTQQGSSIIPRARNGDAITSVEAAERAKAFAMDHRACILGVMWRPLDASRIAALTGLSIEQCCRRLPEMEREGSIGLTGRTIEGLNGSNFREWERVA